MLLALVASPFVVGALVLPAHAEPAGDALMAPEDCGGTMVTVTSPAPLATGVPIDVVPAGILSPGGCDTDVWVITLTDASTGEEIASATQSEADALLLEVDPGRTLDPETTYTVRFEPTGGSGEVVEIGFTTGTATAAGLDGAPSIADAVVTWQPNLQMIIGAEVTAAASSDGPTIITVAAEGEDGSHFTSVSGPSAVWHTGVTDSPTEPPEEVCIVGRQRDIAGNWSESPAVCVAPEIIRDSSGGCVNVTRGAPTGGLLGLLLAVGLARRKSA